MRSYSDIAVERLFCRSGLLNFTRYMFNKKTEQRYLVGPHHRKICEALDKVVTGKTRKLIINIAPRYGKTELVSKMFIAYGFAINPKSKFIHLSYSKDLVTDNSREVREMCSSGYFTRLFPGVRVVGKSAGRWKTSEGGQMYAVSSGGQVTGFGAGALQDKEVSPEDVEDEAFPYFSTTFSGAIVIDDPLKSNDALSDTRREGVNQHFETTIRSRANNRNTPIVVIMQRQHEHDLCGYLMEIEPDEWEVLSLPCLYVDENGEEHALWDVKHTKEELYRLRDISPFVFDTQYQQEPTPKEGLMYTVFRTYATLPVGSYVIKNYTDTADTGSDYLASADYAEFPNGECYLLDVLYTDKPMEYTEPETARMLNRDSVQEANIESNNGGRGFARNVERNLRELGNRRTAINTFTQSSNKQARIFTHSAEVQNLIFYPEGWEKRWPLFYNAVRSYRKTGRNAHDDAPDMLTGIVEKIGSSGRSSWSRT